METNLARLKVENEGEDSRINFKFYMQMVHKEEISWNAFVSLVNDLTPTLSKSKQLITVLLEEIKNLMNEKRTKEILCQDSIYTTNEIGIVDEEVIGPNPLETSIDEKENDQSQHHAMENCANEDPLQIKDYESISMETFENEKFCNESEPTNNVDKDLKPEESRFIEAIEFVKGVKSVEDATPEIKLNDVLKTNLKSNNHIKFQGEDYL